MRPIYFDHNATTPVEEEVLQRMLPFFRLEYGNPSNTSHVYGWAADEAVTMAREQVAALIGAKPEELIFTCGATEAINTVIKGIYKAYRGQGKHILTVENEHKAVIEACQCLGQDGCETTLLPVDKDGLVTAEQVRRALRPDTVLVSVMWANNETGAIQPIAEITDVVRDHQALFFTDATQAIGKVPVSVEGIDLLACSAHKFYGPKGVGALYVRSGKPHIRLPQLLHGGGQEGGRRASTLNVPGIVGMGEAARIALERLEEDRTRMAAQRDLFEQLLEQGPADVRINARGADRLPQTSNVTFRGVRAADMMAQIGRIAVSAGSACASGSGKPSHVLSAMGLSKEDAEGTVRFSMGRHTTDEEIREAARYLNEWAAKHEGNGAGVGVAGVATTETRSQTSIGQS